MLQMVKYFIFLIIAFISCSCTHLDVKGLFMPTSDGVQTRFVQSSKMNEGLKAGVIEADENYVFYAATDPHIDQETTNLSLFNDASRNDEETLFSVLLGDCTDIRDNLPAYLDALAYSPEKHLHDFRIFHVLGNHQYIKQKMSVHAATCNCRNQVLFYLSKAFIHLIIIQDYLPRHLKISIYI